MLILKPGSSFGVFVCNHEKECCYIKLKALVKSLGNI